MIKTQAASSSVSVEEKLRLLYKLQETDSQIDEILTLRGELPLEVKGLEDEIVGLQTRIANYEDEVAEMESMVAKKKHDIVESNGLIARYREQQNNVRNNREFDSLSKEIEFQTLEIELSEKRIKEFTAKAKEKSRLAEETQALIEDKQNALSIKQKELLEITSETQKEEEALRALSSAYKTQIEERLLKSYERTRGKARNGLAVVVVSRDACGGCFNKIPPQRQVDIMLNKKILVCEYCGRILIDPSLTGDIE